MKKLLIIDRGRRLDPVSYSDDWVDSFRAHSGAKVDVVTDPLFLKWGRPLLRLQLSSQYDGIFIMHSVSNDMGFGASVAKLLSSIKGPVFFFVGNEYRDLAAKVSLASEMKASYLLSQLPNDVAEKLYRPSFAGKIMEVAHALNDNAFAVATPVAQRKTDIGYRGEKYPYYLGQNDREVLFDYFKGTNLKLDIAAGRGKGKRLPRAEWAAFLNSCRTTIATETGAEHVSLDDRVRFGVFDYEKIHPQADFKEIQEKAIAPIAQKGGLISGRAISSRHFDSIGCGTAIIAFPGRFNDILKADEHYVAMKRDFSNADEVLGKIGNVPFLDDLTRRTQDYVLKNHCLKHRIHSLMEKL